MKKILLFLLIVNTLTSIAQTPDCKKFRTGTFYYPEIPDYGYTIREKKVQKGYIKAKDMLVTWNVKWVNDCSYELTFKEAKNNDGVFNLGDRITATIISVDGDCYKFTCIFYSAKYPNGKEMPVGEMCLKKD